MKPSLQPPCPCGSARAYRACCGQFHDDWQVIPADAESLMRSRYSAYVYDLRDYLLRTWHPSTRPTALTEPEPALKWLGLQVRDSGMLDDGSAFVEFVARSRLAGRGQRLHEKSRFVREDGRWFYVDGDLRAV